MTDKELQKLGRRELLQLLLDQAKETDRLSKLLKETEDQLRQMEEGYERLRERLDQKDVQIHELQDTLQAEREKRDVDLSEVGSIAEAALRLNGVFDAAQQAADQYLQSVKKYYAPPGGAEPQLDRLSYLDRLTQLNRSGQLGRQFQPEPELGPDRDVRDSEFYPPEPARPRPAAREPEPEPVERQPARREREEPSQSRLPFRVKKRKEAGKTTLFFGWQHD